MNLTRFNHEVNWAQFETCNANVQEAFEQLCCWLFNETFFDGKKLLHSNPNNPGVEVTPVLHPESNKKISFQAKYFSEMNYHQIKGSAEKAVKYYAGRLDVIYLYCNKDVNVTSKQYQSIVSVLGDAGIELVPITNQRILEQVIKNETLCWYFFDQIVLSDKWYEERLNVSLHSLGPRYNKEFNFSTQTEGIFNFFLCSEDAVKRINQGKVELISKLIQNRSEYWCCKSELQTVVAEIEKLEDISLETIFDCFKWGELLENRCLKEFAAIKLLAKAKRTELLSIDSRKSLKEYIQIKKDVEALEYLLTIPHIIAPSSHIQNYMQSQTLIVTGKAGTGKSQLLAVAAEKLVNKKRGVIFLLGTNYINDHILYAQTAELVGGGLALDALLHKLEAKAVQANTYSYIFIDAINESVYKDVWKTGLDLLLAVLSNYPHIKVVLSVRLGYEKLVFSDAIHIALENGKMARLEHMGFREESIEATMSFLNYYGIPFLPAYFLQTEMTNPLFLTMFCKNYKGEDFDIFSLFDQLIEKADFEAQKAIGITSPMLLLNELVEELARIRLETNTSIITKGRLFDLNFWDRYGLTSNKIPYVVSLVKSGLLIDMVSGDDEAYSLGYNLLEDFVCAKAIIKQYPEKDALIEYLLRKLLKAEKGTIENYHNIDIFIVVCSLYAEKYHEECFGEVSQKVKNSADTEDLVDRYLESFVWRASDSVDERAFISFLSKEVVEITAFFRVLIETSTKEHHPLNAFFLHKFLINKKMAERDALWTDFINYLTTKDERILQLIAFFDKGNILENLSYANTELLLILFVWLLTSSNRILRDKASKAAIELLRREFTLCKRLLQHFEGVDDPYVLQRLYGIIFGATMKRNQEDKEAFKELAMYVYVSIFDQEFVYPDILLRDYARLILERWRYEYPEESEFITLEEIVPPYRSLPIPVVEKQQYYDQVSSNSGFNCIDLSMRVCHADCPGLYGDFGRYVFQSAFEDFENVDIGNLYHYAMQFIREELGYNERLGELDSVPNYYRYSRHDTKKVERIGKKYQWIAFYNILARTADHHRVKQWDGPARVYEGPWDPYVRDFDPTLNNNFLYPKTGPVFDVAEENHTLFLQEQNPQKEDIQQWLQTKPEEFTSIHKKLLQKDSSGDDWVALRLYEDKERKAHAFDDLSYSIAKGTQKIWLIADAYFVKKHHFDTIIEHVMSDRFVSNSFPEVPNVYQLFNREYAWSPGYKSVFADGWKEYEIDVGSYRIETEIMEVPDFDNIFGDFDGEVTIPLKKVTVEKKIPEAVINVEIMPAATYVLWEEGYDASQEESTSFYIPCGDIIRQLQLEQKNSDGCYYSKDGTLVSFYGKLSGLPNGLFIRAEYLKKYLQDEDLQLMWTCFGEKQYFLGDLRQEWSDWKGYFSYRNDEICGEFERYKREYK